MLVDGVGATAAELEAMAFASGDVPPLPVDMMVPRDEVDEAAALFDYVFGDDDGGETSPTSSSPGDDDGEGGCPSWAELEADAAADELAAAELEASLPDVATSSSPGDGDGDAGETSPGGSLSDDEATARGLATAATLPRDGRIRWWEIVAWGDSIRDDWFDRFVARPDVRGLAIWHDRDVRDASTGELKKLHLHCMVGDAHGRKWSFRQAMAFAESVFGLRADKDRRLVRPIKKPSGYALYLTHANAPDKARYSRDEVMAFGGVDLDSVVGVVDNRHMILEDIYSWIDEFVEAYEVVPSFAAVVRYANSCRPAWSRVLASSSAKQVLAYVQSFSFDMDMDGRGAGTIRIVRAIIADEKKHGRAAKLSKGGDNDEKE